MKERILESALKQVPFYGWTQDAIVAGIQQDFASSSSTSTAGAGVASLSMAGLCTPRDLVRYHMDSCNHRLRQELPFHLKGIVSSIDATTSGGTISLEDKIVSAFKLRLEYSKHFIEQSRWHEGMALGVSSPEQVWTTTEQLKEIVNIIVDACSDATMPSQQDHDSSNTESHYHHQPRILNDLERIALGGIYVATELHMLTDTSPDYQDSWDFLKQRMNEWKVVSSSDLMASVVGTMGEASSSSSSFGIGDALSVGKTLTLAFASAAASVLQVNPPFSVRSK
jgi:ubiquinone biosynthesis protein COQ9